MIESGDVARSTEELKKVIVTALMIGKRFGGRIYRNETYLSKLVRIHHLH